MFRKGIQSKLQLKKKNLWPVFNILSSIENSFPHPNPYAGFRSSNLLQKFHFRTQQKPSERARTYSLPQLLLHISHFPLMGWKFQSLKCLISLSLSANYIAEVFWRNIVCVIPFLSSLPWLLITLSFSVYKYQKQGLIKFFVENKDRPKNK